MTVTAEQAKALLDAAKGEASGDDRFPWTFTQWLDDFTVGMPIGSVHTPNGPGHTYWQVATEVHINDAGLIAAAPDLAATVVELSAERDRLAVMEARSVAAERDAREWERVAVERTDQRDALQAAIDKVKAEHKPWPCTNTEHPITCHSESCRSCGGKWPCPTVKALTQGGEGS